ncbi:hypothetical protein [Burkholderia diffusa]|uniref:hypothetical protein n=1 Tax=Burkholderia diffusa TaxID=488732 RepID=UPI00076D0C41|nr:hypothetical protein [Burkholderia diffusa]KVM92724.1 hypothetical protein WJ62_26675 [Burkholderia diffusa]
MLTRHVEQDRRRFGAGRGRSVAIHRRPVQFLKAAAIVQEIGQFVRGVRHLPPIKVDSNP